MFKAIFLKLDSALTWIFENKTLSFLLIIVFYSVVTAKPSKPIKKAPPISNALYKASKGMYEIECTHYYCRCYRDSIFSKTLIDCYFYESIPEQETRSLFSRKHR